jgi:hypothetical protein
VYTERAASHDLLVLLLSPRALLLSLRVLLSSFHAAGFTDNRQ